MKHPLTILEMICNLNSRFGRAKHKGSQGAPFDDVFIDDDFRLKGIDDRLCIRNYANTGFKKINALGYYLSNALMFSKSGEHLLLGWPGTRCPIFPDFTTAESLAIVEVAGMTIYNTDLTLFQDYIDAWYSRAYLNKENIFTEEMVVNALHRLKDIGGDLSLRNEADNSYGNLAVNSISLGVETGLSASGTGVIPGLNGNRSCRMPMFTTIERNALTPVVGDMVYDTDTREIMAYINGAWKELAVNP